MKLNEFIVNQNDFITSDRLLNFIKMIQHKNIKYIKTDYIKYRSNNFIKMTNWRDINELVNLNDIQILVSGHSDYQIDQNEISILNNPNLKFWLCQNKNIVHPKLMSVPIGIPNSISNYKDQYSTIFKIIGNTDKIYQISRTPKELKNLVYLNISLTTYPSERKQVVDLYKEQKWVTYEEPEEPTISEIGRYNFLKNIYNHKFVFAPRGNGIDTYRLWESLYLRTIPIVLKCIGMEDFYDLPILFIDNWNNITEDFLNMKYDEIMSNEYNLDKLKLDYWINVIINKYNNV